MSRDIKYIGMDVHKEETVIAVRNGSGKLVMESIVETKASSILQFMHGLQGGVACDLGRRNLGSLAIGKSPAGSAERVLEAERLLNSEALVVSPLCGFWKRLDSANRNWAYRTVCPFQTSDAGCRYWRLFLFGNFGCDFQCLVNRQQR